MIDPIPDKLNQFTERVIGAAIEVHRVLGPGFLESTYEQAMCYELEDAGIAYQRQKPVHLDYKGRPLGEGKIDLLIEDQVVLELKAVTQLHENHATQVLAYLRATGLRLGLLLNFHEPVLVKGIKRVAL